MSLTAYTHQQIADQLTQGYWIDSGFAPHAWPGASISVDLTGLTAEGEQLARWALDAWSALSGLTFIEVPSGGQITFDDDGRGASASNSILGGTTVSSDVNISTGWLATYGTTIDSYSMQTYLHEIGHALGLGHAGNYNGSASYPTDALYLNDSWQATLMSYFDQVENSYIDASFAFAITPMPGDIVAIGDLYGLAPVQAGDTVWGAQSTVGGYLGALFGQIFGEDTADASLYGGNPVALTIRDTGGTDTLDLSPVAADQRINLAAGAVSDILGLTGNLQIASDTVIEHALGGAGADEISGNAASNALDGGGGSDVLNGLDGADTLTGGNGFDTLAGGTGADALSGGARADLLLGEAGDDTLHGGDGNDRLLGGAQNDSLLGGEGNDRALGGNGFDTIDGGEGADALSGGARADLLLGEAGHDTLDGGEGNDRLLGGTGDDSLFGGAGEDRFFGGAGVDTIEGGAGADTLSGGGNADIFIFADGFGTDTINDFATDDAAEKIDLSGVSAILDYADLVDPVTPHISQVGADVVIDDFAGNTITLVGLTLGALDATDFLF